MKAEYWSADQNGILPKHRAGLGQNGPGRRPQFKLTYTPVSNNMAQFRHYNSQTVRILRTGHGACRRSFSAVLPIKRSSR